MWQEARVESNAKTKRRKKDQFYTPNTQGNIHQERHIKKQRKKYIIIKQTTDSYHGRKINQLFPAQ